MARPVQGTPPAAGRDTFGLPLNISLASLLDTCSSNASLRLLFFAVFLLLFGFPRQVPSLQGTERRGVRDASVHGLADFRECHHHCLPGGEGRGRRETVSAGSILPCPSHLAKRCRGGFAHQARHDHDFAAPPPPPPPPPPPTLPVPHDIFPFCLMAHTYDTTARRVFSAQ